VAVESRLESVEMVVLTDCLAGGVAIANIVVRRGWFDLP